MISEMISLAVLSQGFPRIYSLDESSLLESANSFALEKNKDGKLGLTGDVDVD